MSDEKKREKLKEIMERMGRILPETVAIRPPSEAKSLLIRATRGCSWKRCVYCSAYSGQNFSIRGVEDIKADVDLYQLQYGPDVRRVFLGDGDALEMGIDPLIDVLRYIGSAFPRLERVTSYSTPLTLGRSSVEELKRLKAAGLGRLHVGMESGDDEVLYLMQKGVDAATQIEAGRKVVESGMELSEYIMLGLGGQERWEQHIEGSAKAINTIEPHFTRIRTLAFAFGAPAFEEFDARRGKLKIKLYPEGYAELQTPEGILAELRALLKKLDVSGYLTCDHNSNYFPEVNGRLPEEREAMLSILDGYEEGMASGRIRLPRVKLFT